MVGLSNWILRNWFASLRHLNRRMSPLYLIWLHILCLMWTRLIGRLMESSILDWKTILIWIAVSWSTNSSRRILNWMGSLYRSLICHLVSWIHSLSRVSNVRVVIRIGRINLLTCLNCESVLNGMANSLGLRDLLRLMVLLIWMHQIKRFFSRWNKIKMYLNLIRYLF